MYQAQAYAASELLLIADPGGPAAIYIINGHSPKCIV